MASSSHVTMTLLLAFAVAASFFIPSAVARNFDVGGKDGWVVKPSESYDHWAHRLRFLVNDSLVFKYKQGSNSVAQVKKEDYDSCQASKKLKIMKSGTSIFKLTQSGLFYFISGNKKQCLDGQKLVVLVLAVRSPPAATPKTPATPPPPPPTAVAPALPPAASPPPSSSPPPSPASSSSTAPSPGSTTSPAGGPAGSGNWGAGQPGASPPGPAVSPDTADLQTSPPEAAKKSSSSSAVASPALVAVGLGFIALFM